MNTTNLEKLDKTFHFPITRAIPEPRKEVPLYKRLLKFGMYRRKFEIMEDYILWIPWEASYLFIPKGFIFDGASVPKILNGLYSPTGVLLGGAGPHDFGYRYKALLFVNVITGDLYIDNRTKAELDNTFQSLCERESGMVIASGAATLMLSICGFIGWRQNKKTRIDIQKDFPHLIIEDINETI